MNRNYWTGLNAAVVGISISTVLLIVVYILFRKQVMKYGQALFLNIGALIALVLSIDFVVPYVKDYKYVINDQYIEISARMIEFTEVRYDADSGQVNYSRPRFYIEDKDEYIILGIKDVEEGRTYLIRYYPNTKLCEVVNLIE
jgi:hypothetical protein